MARDLEKKKISDKRWRDKNTFAFQQWKYGISEDEYNKMLDDQDGCCAICKSTDHKGTGSRFQVDHDHITGKVRELLCWSCNIAIGKFEDDAERILRAHHYVKRHK